MHVAGTRSTKSGYGVVTLATAVVTGINLFDVLTADLAFAQVSTEHPLVGHVPSVSFLGTRFENLRIAGREVEPVFDHGICGQRPAGDVPYVKDSAFLSRVAGQYESIRNSPGLSESEREQYHWDSSAAAEEGKVECSLVTSIGNAPGRAYGNIADIPDFGKISIAELSVSRAFHLTLLKLDSPRKGKLKGPIAMANGSSTGPGIGG